MRELIANIQMSLDGVMQAPGGPEEDPTGGFEHGGWSFAYFDEVAGEAMGSTIGRPHDLVLGRRTYEIFAAYWPYHENAIGRPLNAATKYVASRGTPDLPWATSHLLGPDVVTALRELKQTDGPELQMHGSVDLLHTLFAHGLVDVLNVFVAPLVLGRGKRPFGDDVAAFGLTLERSQVTPSGMIVATYRTGTDLPSGSHVEGEEPSERELARRARLAQEVR